MDFVYVKEKLRHMKRIELFYIYERATNNNQFCKNISVF